MGQLDSNVQSPTTVLHTVMAMMRPAEKVPDCSPVL
jgi:hypothetical protein